MSATTIPIPVHDRILATAFDLFYRQGYRATGINQIIAESGVAKATFYAHFPSKEDLLYEYIQTTARREVEEAREGVAALDTAEERFFHPLRMLIPWFEASEFRGCPFQNIAAEAPLSDDRIRQAVLQHHKNLHAFLRELTVELLAERAELAPLDPDRVADAYLLLLEGTIALAVPYRNALPVQYAIQTLESLLIPN